MFVRCKLTKPNVHGLDSMKKMIYTVHYVKKNHEIASGKQVITSILKKNIHSFPWIKLLFPLVRKHL